MKTTDAGYINKNNQKNLGCRGVSGTHYNQKFFEMECLDCGHKYLANGCDVWLRKCPVCGVTKSRKVSVHVQGKRSTRVISDKLRYQVLKRDNFKCCACGASPDGGRIDDAHSRCVAARSDRFVYGTYGG